jgi:hypothetical protein
VAANISTTEPFATAYHRYLDQARMLAPAR